MTITAYFPVIFCDDLEASLKKYEAMGFERLHTTENFAMKSYVLEINGNRIEIFHSDMDMFKMDEGYYGMRVNVREFDEGLAYYENEGYKMIMGPFENDYAKVAILEDDKKRHIFLYYHKRKSEN